MLDIENDYDDNSKGTYWLTGENISAKGKTLPYGSEMKLKNIDKLPVLIGGYFPNIVKYDEAGIYFIDGSATGSYVKTADGYFGTYPRGLISVEDYDYDLTVEDCIEYIEEKVGK